MAFVLGAAGPVLHRLRWRSRWVAMVLLLGFFATVTRFEPSVLRAVAMAALAVTAAALGRPASGLRVLSLAVVLLVLVDPLLVRSLGFQLSVAASGSILIAAGPIAARLPGPRPLALAVAVPLAAQVGTSPLLVARNGPLPAIALVANVLVEPAAGLVMTWGSSIGVIAGFLPGGAAAVLSWPSRLLLIWIRRVALACARMPALALSGRQLLGLGGIAALAWGPAAWRAHRDARRALVEDVGPDAAARLPGATDRTGRRLGPGRLLVVGLGAAAVTAFGAPAAAAPRALPDGAALFTDGTDEVVVISRPVDGARVLRALRGRVHGRLELLVVASPSSGAWRAGRDVLDRYDGAAVLTTAPRPGVELLRPGDRIALGALSVTSAVDPASGAARVTVDGARAADAP